MYHIIIILYIIIFILNLLYILLKSCREYQRLILKSKQPISIQNLCCELCKYNGEALILKKIENWKIPKFQIRGGKLIKLGVEGKFKL